MHDGPGRNPGQVEQLVRAEAQDGSRLDLQACHGSPARLRDECVELGAPPERARREFDKQPSVLTRHQTDSCMLELRAERGLPTLDGKQESRRRDTR